MSHQKFYNKIINKKDLKLIIHRIFESYSIIKATNLVENFKKSGFYFATKAGISISIDDLKVPPIKNLVFKQNNDNINLNYLYEKRGNITQVERFQKVIGTWHDTSNLLKNELVEFFKTVDPLNPVYIMTFSGARGNLSQVRQLVGMRGLMSDPSGQIIEVPIKANFREGLSITDYLISGYGARKGIVDTALKTANSGYLTRRLVDVAQHVLIRELDCKTKNGIRFFYNPGETNLENFLGRVLAKSIFQKNQSEILLKHGQTLTAKNINLINFPTNIILRSPLICESNRSICQKCYGWNLAQSQLVEIGEAVGIIAAQSIGEPGTQLTMRTFHTGGIFTGESKNQILSKFTGKVLFSKTLTTVVLRTSYGEVVLESQTESYLYILVNNSQLKKIPVKTGMLIYCPNNSFINKGDLILEIPTKNQRTKNEKKRITSGVSGEVQLQNLTHSQIQTLDGLVWIANGQVYDITSNMLIKTRGKKITKNNSIAQSRIIAPVKLNGIIKTLTTRTGLRSLMITGFNIFSFNHLYKNNYEIIFNLNQKYNIVFPNSNKYHFFGSRKTNKYTLPIPYLFFYPKMRKFSGISGFQIYLLLPYYYNTFYNNNRNIFVLSIAHREAYEYLIDIDRTIIFPGEIVTPSFISTRLSFCYVKWVFNTQTCYFLNPLTQCSLVQHLSFNNKHNQFVPQNLDLITKIGFSTRHRDTEGLLINENQSFIDIHLNFVKITGLESQFKVIRKNLLKTKLKEKMLVHFLLYTLKTKLPSRKRIDDNVGVTPIYQVVNNQYMDSYSIIATINSIVRKKIKVGTMKTRKYNPNRLLVTTAENYKKYNCNNNTELSKSKFIVVGDEIQPNQYIKYSGYNVSSSTKNQSIKLRLCTPLFISAGTQIFVKHGSLIHEGQTICELISKRILSDDIVSGLPRVEKLLEARGRNVSQDLIENPGVIKYNNARKEMTILEKNQLRVYEYDPSAKFAFKKGKIVFVGQPIYDCDLGFDLSTHSVLNTYFKYYCSLYSAKKATLLSITNIQILILNLIQNVYKSQGIDIADKHLEVIIRQITSKVEIVGSDLDTFFMPTEYIEFNQVDYVNEALKFNKKPLVKYRPVLLGITKVSLTVEGFISAASFQETTRVLIRAAIEGRVEWLRGLKENVILGRLIPAGTGFRSFYNPFTSDVRA